VAALQRQAARITSSAQLTDAQRSNDNRVVRSFERPAVVGPRHCVAKIAGLRGG
jgi:hypothetical protein